MNWKQIEQKPGNWETLQKVIRQSRSTELSFQQHQSSVEWRSDILASFLPFLTKAFPSTATVFLPLPSTIDHASGTAHDKKKKVQKPSRKHAIHEQVNQRQLEREWSIFRLDDALAPHLQGRFTFRISIVAFLVWWCMRVLFHADAKVRRTKTAVDALLSLEKSIRWMSRMTTACDKEESVRLDWLHVLHAAERLVKSKWAQWHSIAIHHLFRDPQMMVKCYFDTLDTQIGLYPEQLSFISIIIDAVLFDQPLLLGDQRPPGAGKTFMAAPLAQKLSMLDRKKILLFTCPNELVRIDVARNALMADNLHVWMGRKAYLEEKDNQGSFIRPHKTCFPSNWKKIYRASDHEKKGSIYTQFTFYAEVTKRWPDIIVCDMETCLAVLQTPELAPHLLFLMDEVVWNDPVVEQQIAQLLRHSPRITVLMSSILPQWQHVPAIVTAFLERHPSDTPLKTVRRIETEHDVSISCSVIDPEGCLCMPHHRVDWADVPLLVQRLQTDPLVGRLFAPQHVYAMMKQVRIPEERFQFAQYFASICDITHQRTRKYMIELLQFLVATDDEQTYAAMQAYRPALVDGGLDPSRCHEGLLSRTFASLHGKTLTAVANEGFGMRMQEITAPFLEGAPKLSSLEQARAKRQEMKEARERLLQRTKDLTPEERQMELAELQEMDLGLQWPDAYVYQSHAHLRRFGLPTMGRRDQRSPSLPAVTLESLDDWSLELLLGRIGVYENKTLTAHQRMLVLDAFADLGMIFSGRELVFGTNISNLTNLCITPSFGEVADRGVLYQLIGRIGRVGHSYEARVLASSARVMDMIFSWQTEEDSDFRHSLDRVMKSQT